MGFFTRDLIISIGLRWFFTDSSSLSTSSLVFTSRIAQAYIIITRWNSWA